MKNEVKLLQKVSLDTRQHKGVIIKERDQGCEVIGPRQFERPLACQKSHFTNSS